MAMTHDYLDHLNESFDISPANSQEELQAAQVISELMEQHGLEATIEDFDAPKLSRAVPAVISVVSLVGMVLAGVGALPLTLLGLVLAAIPAALSVMRLFGHTPSFGFGPRAQSQNVVAVHRATGPLVTKGSRTIVVCAHYDSPRENFLYSSPVANYLPLVTRLSVPCSFVVAACAILQILLFLPAVLRVIVWIVGVLAAVPAVVVAVGTIAGMFAPCTDGANDNKSGVAAMLGVLENVRPSGVTPKPRPAVPAREIPVVPEVDEGGETADVTDAEEPVESEAAVESEEYFESEERFEVEEGLEVEETFGSEEDLEPEEALETEERLEVEATAEDEDALEPAETFGIDDVLDPAEIVELDALGEPEAAGEPEVSGEPEMGTGQIAEDTEGEDAEASEVNEADEPVEVGDVAVDEPEPEPAPASAVSGGAREAEASSVRHGAEVLRSLQILPPSCEIEYVGLDAEASSAASRATDSCDETIVAEGVRELQDASDADSTLPTGRARRPRSTSDADASRGVFRTRLSSVARRASLFDLPDPSGNEVDPLDTTGASPRASVTAGQAATPEPLETITAPEDDEDAPTPDKASPLRAFFDRVRERFAGFGKGGDQADDDESDDDEADEGRVWRGGAAVRGGLRLVDDVDVFDGTAADEQLDGVFADDDFVETVPDDDQLRDEVLSLADDALIAHDIWFVALGGSSLDHAGMRSFLSRHRPEIRGCFVINLDCVGAGQLTLLKNEGLEGTRRADRRVSRMLSNAAADLHIELATEPHDWEDTDATPAMRSSLRSVTIMGVGENGLPALSRTPEDLEENVDGDKAAQVAALVTEVIRRS